MVPRRVISADSHLEMSPERWTPRVPARYRDLAPRLVKLPDGGDGVMVEGQPLGAEAEEHDEERQDESGNQRSKFDRI